AVDSRVTVATVCFLDGGWRRSNRRTRLRLRRDIAELDPRRRRRLGKVGWSVKLAIFPWYL
ncbi:hypothetical protein LINPERHAP2_LOCUS25272, partial [Linum perenne]